MDPDALFSLGNTSRKKMALEAAQQLTGEFANSVRLYTQQLKLMANVSYQMARSGKDF
jgi:hypothetical protein